MFVPTKLKPGDEIRVIAPSRSANILSKVVILQAMQTLESLGFVLSFGQHIFKSDLHFSTSIKNRVKDVHDAFTDSNVKGILAVIGGYNSNELLPYLDYDLIAQHPKVFCGYSDTTAVATAIMEKSGFVTYSGPSFSSFAMEEGQTYQSKNFMNCVTQETPFAIEPSNRWSDDQWYIEQDYRRFRHTNWKVFNEGRAEGKVYGGNLSTLNLLQGTPYLGPIEDAILFVEDDELTSPEVFARDLTSLLQYVRSIKGLVIGRFQDKSNLTEEQLEFILFKHPQLRNVPVIYDVDFGHTQPIFTFPIGGTVNINTNEQKINLIEF